MRYYYPLKQHIGLPSLPVVHPGDLVKRGQLLAEKPDNQLGANLFSSVSGTVEEVTETTITVQEQNTDFSKWEPLGGTTPQALLEESGLVGLGGAGFPTYVKMASKLTPEGYLLVNVAECEPILNHNIERISRNPEGLLRALPPAMALLGVHKVKIGMKKKHKTAFDKLSRAVKALPYGGVEVVPLPDMYPAGEERALVRDMLGILLSPESLPSAADCVVINGETLWRLGEAILDKKPLMDKDVTVGGKLVENGTAKVFLDVPLGLTVGDLLEKAGGVGPEYGELIMGGPFTGKRTLPEAPMVKTTGGILAAECFMKGPEKIGLLVCACGADERRMEELAASLGSEVAGVVYCKQAKAVGRGYKCENPGHCPGQIGKVLALKKAGAQGVLIGNCTDCTNTVMQCAPPMGMPVYHCTDGALRAVNLPLVRRMKS